MTSRRAKGSAILVTLIVSMLFWQFGAATTRADLLAQFISANQTNVGGFQDTNNVTLSDDQLSVFVAYSNVQVLNRLNKLDEIDKTKAQNWFLDKFDFAYNAKELSDLYYSYQGIIITEAEVNSTVLDQAKDSILQLQNQTTLGFVNKDFGESIMADTYYAVEFLYLAGGINNISAENISSFVMSCWDSDMNLFASKPDAQGNPVDTFFALKLLERMSQLSLLTDAEKAAVADYIDSLYVSDSTNDLHYGGYTYTPSNPFSSLVLTYYCVSIQQIISGPIHTKETLNWVLSRQNPNDYGFQEIQSVETQGHSSAMSSYYAVETIFMLDSDPLENSLSEDIWELENNPWIIAAIWLSVIAGIALIIIIIVKYKNRI